MPSTATSILDGLSTSVAVKAPCRTVATSNITLAGLQTISGYTTVENDRVLVKGQTNPVDNGIYMASTGSWTRAKDADGNRDLVQGSRVLVRSATIDGVEYELTTANPIVIGTTALAFELRYGASATYDQTEAEIAASVTPVERSKKPGNIRRYYQAGVVDGTTDVAYAFRKALDLAAQDGTTVTCDPPGLIKIGSTVYIPQSGGFNSENGFEISLYGSVIIGQGNGVGTIFETGTGAVSTAGATNFGQPNESATSLHLGAVIKGARFRSFGTAIRVFNFVQGCSLRDLWFEDGDRALYAFRSFYLTMFNCIGRLTTSDAVFHFDTECNLITIIGCSGLGTGGVGWLFDGGVKGLLINNTAAEGSTVGFKFTGQILGAALRGCYIEGNTTGIDLGTQPKTGLNIAESYFVLNTTDITADNWQSGELGANAFEDGAVVNLGGNGNYCRVLLPPSAYPDTGAGNHTGWLNVPSGWTINESIEVVHSDYIYSAATGGQALIARMEPVHSGNRVVAFKYAGHGGPLSTNFIPFCTTSLQNADDDLRIDTKIDYGAAASAMFDVQVNDSIGQYNVSGRVVFSNVVYRDDVTAATVVASDNSGLLRITIAGFNNITSYTGSVRIV